MNKVKGTVKKVTKNLVEFFRAMCYHNRIGGFDMFVSGVLKSNKMVSSVQMDNGETLCGA